MKKIIIASGNQHKLKEIKEFLKDLPYHFIGLDEYPDFPEIEETGDSLLENALIKARTIHNITGLPSIGDDTGLEVDYLNGLPGVRSARFAGENAESIDNVKLLLKKCLLIQIN